MPAGKPHRAEWFTVARGPRGWKVKTRVNWHHAREVSILAPVLAQPNGTIQGYGFVGPCKRGVIVILA